MPKVSVVIPVYNKASFIEQTLHSVFDQTYTDFEIIAINDGSKDSSAQVLDRMQHQQLTVIHQENKGLSATRNKGIKHAKGEIIALLDADDIWLPHHLERLISLTKLFPDASLYGTGYAELFSNGTAVRPHINFIAPENACLITDFFESNLYQPLIIPSSFAFQRTIVDEIGGFDESITYSEDVDFYIKSNLAFSCAYDPTITCHYRMESEHQITQSTISERQLPDFQKYLNSNPNHSSLKKYINLKRYFLCNFYKAEGEMEQFQEMRALLDEKLLNTKQKLLLDAPRKLLVALRKIKFWLLKKGKRVTTF